MTENLNIGTAIMGNLDQSNNGSIEKYCYNDLAVNCDVYGGLYQWAEMVQYFNGATNTTSWNPVPTGPVQGICPTGWHLPSDAEWTILTTYLGGVSVAGGKMKEVGTAHWLSPNNGATNSSGFTGLPGGLCYNGPYSALTFYGNFWSDSEFLPNIALTRFLDYYFPTVNNPSEYKTSSCSVRCIRD